MLVVGWNCLNNIIYYSIRIREAALLLPYS
jgi:hypothetical protein